jgi:prepilin-type N-terminal cleavage/methylation domain-containing protein
MGRRGFSLIELFVVFVVIGIVVMFGTPRVRDAIERANVRSARVAVGTYAVIARSAAIQRGCRSALHFAYGTSSRIWVTACRLASPTTVDTIGPVKSLYNDFKVTMTATLDSVRYDARGLSLETASTLVRVTGNSAGNTDSLVINSYTGKVVR